MTITFPLSLSSFWDDITLLGGGTEFELQQNRKQSVDGGGNMLSASFGMPKWRGDYQVVPVDYLNIGDVEPLFKALQGRDGTFLAYDKRRPYPKGDPTGVMIDAGTQIPVGGEASFGDTLSGVYRAEGVAVPIESVLSIVSGAGTRFNVSGVLEDISANTIRIDYDPVSHAALGVLAEVTTTNRIRNNTMVGAAAGTPGTPPTNWAVGVPAGISSQIVGTGVENGISYAAIRIFGTATATGNWVVWFETVAGIAALTAQTWTLSAFLKLVSGSFPTNAALGMDETTAGGAFLAGGSAAAAVTSALLRYSYARTLSGGGTVALVRPYAIGGITNGQVVDFTIRVGLPQIENSPSASMPIKTTNAAVTRASDTLTFKSKGVNNFTLTFDDNSTQPGAGAPANWTPLSSGLTRPRIKSWVATRATQPAPATVQIKSKGADNRSIALKGLPSGFQIYEGDKFSVLYSATKYFLCEAMEAAIADGAGDTAEFEVQPFLPSGLAVNDAVTLKKPCAKFKLVAGSYSPAQGQGNISSGIGFSMVSVP